MPSHADTGSKQPLLPTHNRKRTAGKRVPHRNSDDESDSIDDENNSTYAQYRKQARTFLSSRAQHYIVLSLVALDVLGIFADITINLYQCDLRNKKVDVGDRKNGSGRKWDEVREGLAVAGLVFSCLFMAELLFSVWAFGWHYFNSNFHRLDAAVIATSFAIDVVLHNSGGEEGVLEEVASLVVILRLWRFVKVVEEFSAGAEEQMEGLEEKIEELKSENRRLRNQLSAVKDRSTSASKRKGKSRASDSDEEGDIDGEERREAGTQSPSGRWR